MDMPIMAKWGKKKWEVSPKKILALESLETSFALMADTGDAGDAEGRPPARRRRLELQPLSFGMLLSDAAGVRVRDELNSWKYSVGKSAPLYLGGRRFGPRKLMLTGAGVSDAVIDNFGRLRQAYLSLSFVEDAPEAAKDKHEGAGGAVAGPASGGPAYGASAAGGSAYGASAVGIGATPEDKAAMKPMAI